MRTEGEEELPRGEAAAPHPAWGGAAAVFRARKRRGHTFWEDAVKETSISGRNMVS